MAIGFDRPILGAPTQTSLFARVRTFFDENRWNYQRLDGQPVLLTAFIGTSGTWRAAAVVNEVEQQISIFSMVDTQVPDEHRPAVMEYITRANFGLGLGNFEMDLTDDEVRCKTCLSAESQPFNRAALRMMVRHNAMLMDQFAEGLCKVAQGEQTPLEAIADAATRAR